MITSLSVVVPVFDPENDPPERHRRLTAAVGPHTGDRYAGRVCGETRRRPLYVVDRDQRHEASARTAASRSA